MTPRDDTVMAKLAEIMRETFQQPDAVITRESTSDDIDGWDSISHALLLMTVERRFGVTLDTDEALDLANAGELADLVRRTLDGAAS